MTYWTDQHIERLNAATNFSEAAEMALDVLSRMPRPIIQVCGPMTTGGFGSYEKNVKHFNRAIKFLERSGYNVFDQVPLEEPILRLELAYDENGYPMAMLEELYLPLFKSGYIDTLFFLPDWESSTGSRWEHEQAKRLGIKIEYFPENWDSDL